MKIFTSFQNQSPPTLCHDQKNQGKGNSNQTPEDDSPKRKKRKLRLDELDKEGNAIHYRQKARDLIDTLENKLKSLARVELDLQFLQRENKALEQAAEFLGKPSEDGVLSEHEWLPTPLNSDDEESSSSEEEEMKLEEDEVDFEEA